ncbi:hypothetical protein CKAH01_01248 [Colletotrichum kahawae]|uniref:Uncharacterized protein n=1 Tax=Colletotrichum kahawae TaxID=34407 RepID=A0AAD9YA63_COLKA|nr:hypothetical protein CKAH01_01248 [Colletotrichum kahawae]
MEPGSIATGEESGIPNRHPGHQNPGLVRETEKKGPSKGRPPLCLYDVDAIFRSILPSQSMAVGAKKITSQRHQSVALESCELDYRMLYHDQINTRTGGMGPLRMMRQPGNA